MAPVLPRTDSDKSSDPSRPAGPSNRSFRPSVESPSPPLPGSTPPFPGSQFPGSPMPGFDAVPTPPKPIDEDAAPMLGPASQSDPSLRLTTGSPPTSRRLRGHRQFGQLTLASLTSHRRRMSGLTSHSLRYATAGLRLYSCCLLRVMVFSGRRCVRLWDRGKSTVSGWHACVLPGCVLFAAVPARLGMRGTFGSECRIRVRGTLSCVFA